MRFNSSAINLEHCAQWYSTRGPTGNPTNCSRLDPTRHLDSQVMLGDLWREHNAACKSPSRSWSPSPTLDACYAARGNACHGLHDQCTFAEDVARMAVWVERNKERLPRHIFVIDSPPVHHNPINNLDHGRWRTAVRSIWQAYAPSVHVFATSEVLVAQGAAKILAHDPMHWCIDSAQYEQYLSVLLTSIVGTIRQQKRQF